MKEFLDEKGWVVPLGDVKGWEEKKGLWSWGEKSQKQNCFDVHLVKELGLLNWNSMKNKECFAKPWETLLDFLIDLKDLLIHYYKQDFLEFHWFLDPASFFLKDTLLLLGFSLISIFMRFSDFLNVFKGRQTESSNLNNSNYLPTKSCPPPPLKQTNIIRSRKWTARSEFRWGVQSRQKVFITEGAIILSSHHRKSFDHCPDPTKF